MIWFNSQDLLLSLTRKKNVILIHKFDIKFRQQFGWSVLFKYVVNYVRWMVNEYNKMSQLLNHPLNTNNDDFELH
jgi:hypothetical protein